MRTSTDPEAGVLQFGGWLRSAALELPIAGFHAHTRSHAPVEAAAR